MLVFPYMQLPGGILRPVIPVIVEGPSGRRIVDGLLDTGSDRTLFPERIAVAIGLKLPTAVSGTIKTAGNVSIGYRLGHVVLELRDSQRTVRWKAEVAFAAAPLQLIHLGQRGVLEFFHAAFQGPQRQIVLDPQASLPSP